MVTTTSSSHKQRNNPAHGHVRVQAECCLFFCAHTHSRMCLSSPSQQEEYRVTWDKVLANPLVKTIEDPLHMTATAKTVYHDVYGA
jgi:hypothetical protein